jgi:hypothetical protein
MTNPTYSCRKYFKLNSARGHHTKKITERVFWRFLSAESYTLSLDSAPGILRFTETLTGLRLRPYNDSEKEPSERNVRKVTINYNHCRKKLIT